MVCSFLLSIAALGVKNNTFREKIEKECYH